VEDSDWEERLTSVVTNLSFGKIDKTISSILDTVLPNAGKFYTPDAVKQKMTYCMQNILHRFEYILAPESCRKLGVDINNISTAPTCRLLGRLCGVFLRELMNRMRADRDFPDKKRINSILYFIEQNYMSDLTLYYMADQFYLNRSYFSTIFKNSTGSNFSKYLCGIRMKKARELLEGTTMKICKIAEKTGYKDASYFARAFKKYYNMGPEEFRKIHANVKLGNGHDQ
jgi:two-component system response regulator YesN